jgi:hypothetical protein
MSTRLLLLSLLAAAGLCACGATGSDHSVAGKTDAHATAPSNEAIAQQYAADLEKAARDEEESHKANLAIMARSEALLARQEQFAERWDKILSTWERQQAQYQKYLDTLPKP